MKLKEYVDDMIEDEKKEDQFNQELE